MKTRKTLIAAAVTMVLGCGQMALAAQNLHEDQWDKVNLYGNTTIAGDSVDDWGPWKEFVQPAAGAPTVALLGALGGDAYRPLPQVDQTLSDVCRAGDMCGYAVFYNGVGSDEKSRISSQESEILLNAYLPAVFALSVQKTDPNGVGEGGYEGDVAGSWRIAALFGASAPKFGESGSLTGGLWEDSYYYELFMSQDHETGSAYIDRTFRVTFYSGDYEYDYQRVADVIAGYIGRRENGVNTEDGTTGFFVAGYTTPLSDMAALQAGSIQASYDGSTSGRFSSSVPVHLDVNFGNSSWSGSWNGGKDSGYVYTQPDSAGRSQLYGQVGFTVTGGTVSGANFSATTANLSATDGTVSGNVQGSFYGVAANTAAGVAAITKTAAPTVETATRLVAPVGYTNGKLTDLFVAVKNTGIPSINAPK